MSVLKMGPRKYRVQIEIGRDPNGKRIRRWTTISGTRKEAERFERDERARLDGGVLVAPDAITVEEWLDKWLPRHAATGHVQEPSRQRYGGIIRVHINPHVGTIGLQKLRPDHITDLRTRWLVDDALSPSTVHKHLHVLRRALSDAVDDGLLLLNPAERVKSPSTRRIVEQRALTRDEVSSLLEASNDSWFAMPMRFALATGVRRGELLALKWEDVDLEHLSVRIRGTKTRHSNRTLRISGQTSSQLRAHALKQKVERFRLGPAYEDYGLVFPSAIGKPKLPRVFARDSRALIDRAKISDPSTVRWHTFRHTAASLWISTGMDIFSVSRRLGHASPAFTLSVYAHLMEGQDEALASVLDALLA